MENRTPIKLDQMLWHLNEGRGITWILDHVTIPGLKQMILDTKDHTTKAKLRKLVTNISPMRKLVEELYLIPFDKESYEKTLPSLEAD